MNKLWIYINALIFIMVIIALNMFTPVEPAMDHRLLASFILILGFIPTFIHMGKKESRIPFLPLFGIIYSFYYALPIFTLKDYSLPLLGSVSRYSIEIALSLAAGGLFMLLLAYYITPVNFINRFIPRISIYWNLQKAKSWAIILGIIGLIFSYIRLIAKIPLQFDQIALFLSELSIISIGILFILQLQGRLNKAGKVLLWIVFLPLLILVRLGTSATAQIYLIIIFLSSTYWCFRRKIPWFPAVCTLLLFIIFSSFKAEYRKLTLEGHIYSGKNPIEKSILFAQLAFKNKEAFNKGYTVAAIRTSHCLLSFAHVIKVTPQTIPYWMGKSYSALLWSPIPRIIFPWKPAMAMGQDFGHRYSFLHPTDHTTSYSLPQLVEMYVNFGFMGVIIGMFLMGIIYRLLYEMFSHPKSGEGGFLIGLFVFTRLLIIESDFSVVFGNIAYYIILLVIINKLMEEHGQRST